MRHHQFDNCVPGTSTATYEADLHVGYPVEVSGVSINVLLDVFNVLNAQRPVLIDQRWGFQESDNAAATPANPDYHKAVLRTPPTSVRLGVRVTFQDRAGRTARSVRPRLCFTASPPARTCNLGTRAPPIAKLKPAGGVPWPPS